MSKSPEGLLDGSIHQRKNTGYGLYWGTAQGQTWANPRALQTDTDSQDSLGM